MEGSSAELTAGNRELLSAFLATCDRVKFARYSPDEDESRGALQEAKRFLNETAIKRDEAGPTQRRTTGPLAAGEAGAG